jgi:16S rRNA (guanine527-N7)-methyltransferase
MSDLGPVLAVLATAQARGFLGPRPVDDHLAHALAFAAVVGEAPTGLAADLGSGGGVPGLVLAVAWPGSRWALIEGMAKRAEFLAASVASLGLADRVAVHHERTEHLGRPGSPLRAACALVVSRGFGAPSLVAEAAAPLLQVGGALVVSEPPESDGSRWPAQRLAAVGLEPLGVVVQDGSSFMRLRQLAPCPAEYPRGWKRQQRQPLF